MLDTYSQEQKSKLAKLMPNWKPFFCEYQYSDASAHYLLVTLPSEGDPSINLYLYTADEEITVSFGMWEWHYPNPDEPEGCELEAALSGIERIRSEHDLVASYWDGEKWLGSTIVSSNESLGFSSFVKEASFVKVLSWSGRLNREVVL